MTSIKSPGLWAYVMLDSRFSFLRRVRDRIHKLVKVSEKLQAVRIQVSFEQASGEEMLWLCQEIVGSGAFGRSQSGPHTYHFHHHKIPFLRVRPIEIKRAIILS